MKEIVRTNIVRIGNSQGFRIPKNLLKIAGIKDEVELQIKKGSITIRPINPLRHNWYQAFQVMHENQDDVLLVEEQNLSSWDESEWEW